MLFVMAVVVDDLDGTELETAGIASTLELTWCLRVGKKNEARFGMFVYEVKAPDSSIRPGSRKTLFQKDTLFDFCFE